MDLPIFGDQRADGDRGVHMTVLAQVADAATVQRAAMRLELFDDLHCADLWGPGDGTATRA